jgi:rubrerythrin
VPKEALRQALHRAITDEHGSQKYYKNVMERFGRSRRFENLANAEARHSQALLGLFHRYELAPPDLSETKGPVVPESLEAAIELAIKEETANVAMYDEFLRSELPDEARIVFSHLRDASASRHLPALSRGR